MTFQNNSLILLFGDKFQSLLYPLLSDEIQDLQGNESLTTIFGLRFLQIDILNKDQSAPLREPFKDVLLRKPSM